MIEETKNVKMIKPIKIQAGRQISQIKGSRSGFFLLFHTVFSLHDNDFLHEASTYIFLILSLKCIEIMPIITTIPKDYIKLYISLEKSCHQAALL